MSDQLPPSGIKVKDLRPCDVCSKPIVPTFFRLRIERLIIDQGAIRQHLGLAQMLGSHMLAAAMGTDEDAARILDGPADAVVCERCVLAQLPHLFYLLEQRRKEEEAKSQREEKKDC